MMAKSNVVQIFNRGVPTGPEVAKLMALDFPPGSSITYATVEEVIGERLDTKRGRSRFKSVTERWRKKLFLERGLQTEAAGQAFHALTAAQALSVGVSGVNRIRRASARVTAYATAIDDKELTVAERDRHVLLRRQAMALLGVAQDACRVIAPPKAVGK